MSAGPVTAHRLSPEAMRLHLVLVEACQQHRPPCLGRPEWTSEHAEDRVAAVEACSHCLHRAKCHQYAKAAGEHHGVWGARDRTTSASTARRREASA